MPGDEVGADHGDLRVADIEREPDALSVASLGDRARVPEFEAEMVVQVDRRGFAKMGDSLMQVSAGLLVQQIEIARVPSLSVAAEEGLTALDQPAIGVTSEQSREKPVVIELLQQIAAVLSTCSRLFVGTVGEIAAECPGRGH